MNVIQYPIVTHSGVPFALFCLFTGDTDAADQLRSKGDCQERNASGNPPQESGTRRDGGGDGGGGRDGIVVADIDGKLGRTPRALSLSPAATLPNLHLRPCKHKLSRARAQLTCFIFIYLLLSYYSSLIDELVVNATEEKTTSCAHVRTKEHFATLSGLLSLLFSRGKSS